MNTQIFILIMTSKVIEGHKSSSNFRVNPTLPLLDDPLMLPPPNCVDLSLYLFFSLPLSLSKSSPLIALKANLWTLSSLLSLII